MSVQCRVEMTSKKLLYQYGFLGSRVHVLALADIVPKAGAGTPALLWAPSPRYFFKQAVWTSGRMESTL